jgi:uncharacterized membrane protein
MSLDKTKFPRRCKVGAVVDAVSTVSLIAGIIMLCMGIHFYWIPLLGFVIGAMAGSMIEGLEAEK